MMQVVVYQLGGGDYVKPTNSAYEGIGQTESLVARISQLVVEAAWPQLARTDKGDFHREVQHLRLKVYPEQ